VLEFGGLRFRQLRSQLVDFCGSSVRQLSFSRRRLAVAERTWDESGARSTGYE
jgi:hypothetical protein